MNQFPDNDATHPSPAFHLSERAIRELDQMNEKPCEPPDIEYEVKGKLVKVKHLTVEQAWAVYR